MKVKDKIMKALKLRLSPIYKIDVASLIELYDGEFNSYQYWDEVDLITIHISKMFLVITRPECRSQRRDCPKDTKYIYFVDDSMIILDSNRKALLRITSTGKIYTNVSVELDYSGLFKAMAITSQRLMAVSDQEILQFPIESSRGAYKISNFDTVYIHRKFIGRGNAEKICYSNYPKCNATPMSDVLRHRLSASKAKEHYSIYYIFKCDNGQLILFNKYYRSIYLVDEYGQVSQYYDMVDVFVNSACPTNIINPNTTNTAMKLNIRNTTIPNSLIKSIGLSYGQVFHFSDGHRTISLYKHEFIISEEGIDLFRSTYPYNYMIPTYAAHINDLIYVFDADGMSVCSINKDGVISDCLRYLTITNARILLI